MKTIYFILAMGLSLVLNSCSIENRLDRKAEKLIGVWTIDKVIFDKYGSLFKKKVTSEYQNDVFEFLPDNKAYYFDDDINVRFEGNWEIVAERTRDHEGDLEYEFYIDMHFYDPMNHDAFGYYGYISRLSSNKFHFHVTDRSGKLEFRFRRK